MICSLVICSPLHPGGVSWSSVLETSLCACSRVRKQETKLSSETPGEARMKDRVGACRHISKCQQQRGCGCDPIIIRLPLIIIAYLAGSVCSQIFWCLKENLYRVKS